MLTELIKGLSAQQKELLQYAFETESTEYIIINDKFVGVNCRNVPGLIILEEKGVWSYGTVHG